MAKPELRHALTLRLPEETYQLLLGDSEATGIAASALARAYVKQCVERRSDFLDQVYGLNPRIPEIPPYATTSKVSQELEFSTSKPRTSPSKGRRNPNTSKKKKKR